MSPRRNALRAALGGLSILLAGLTGALAQSEAGDTAPSMADALTQLLSQMEEEAQAAPAGPTEPAITQAPDEAQAQDEVQPFREAPAQDASGDGTRAGFAKFSPLPVFADGALEEPVGQRGFEFGAPIEVLEVTGIAVEIVTPEGNVWVNRADIFLPERPRYVVSAPGFRATERPALRFWRGQGVLSEFLSRADVWKSGADFVEFFDGAPRLALKLPVYATDVVDVMGRRPIPVASVMLPLSNAAAGAFDRIRGASSTRHDLIFVVDVSGDAIRFTTESLTELERLLRRALPRSNAQIRIFQTQFAGHLGRGFVAVGETALDGMAEALPGTRARRATLNEPLLKALHAALKRVDPSATSSAIVVLSGANLEEDAFIAALGKRVTLQSPGIVLPDNTSLILAQVSPEPGNGLKTLAGASVGARETVLVEPGPGFAGALSRAIRTALNTDDERLLEPEEMARACALSWREGMLCLMPYEATSQTPLPGPSARGQEGEWYATVAWTVLDGLILELAGNEGETVP